MTVVASRATAALRHLPAPYRARLRALRCCVCRRSRAPAETFRSLVCGRRSCAHVYRDLRARRRRESVSLPMSPKGIYKCSVCRWPLTPPEVGRTGMWGHVVKGRGVCDDPVCREEWLGRRRAEAEARVEDERQLTARLERRRAEAAQAAGLADPDRYPVYRLPANARRLTHLPQHRRQRFADRLYKLITQAVLPPAPDEEAPDPSDPEVLPAAVPGIISACTLCRGNCCLVGSDHAHLRVWDIRRYMAEHPEKRPRHVFADFMERLGERTYEDSCVFHGEQGCRLGEMRGNICRKHFCNGLTGFVRDVLNGEPARAFFVSLGPGIGAHYALDQETHSATPIAGESFVDDGEEKPRT